MTLHRYTMYRGKRPPGDPLPDGVRIDTRRHTRHCLRPPADLVDAYLAEPTDAAWKRFAADYRAALTDRFRDDPTPFKTLAVQVREGDVYIGCSCPTRRNPDVHRCHTVLALRFMRQRFRTLPVDMPV